jgi:hypothetical protein
VLHAKRVGNLLVAAEEPFASRQNQVDLKQFTKTCKTHPISLLQAAPLQGRASCRLFGHPPFHGKSENGEFVLENCHLDVTVLEVIKLARAEVHWLIKKRVESHREDLKTVQWRARNIELLLSRADV